MKDTTEQKNNTGKTFTGVVASVAGDKTLGVDVSRYVKHPKYGKYTKRKKRYAVHTEKEGHTVGEKVMFKETAPISKRKRFILIEDAK